MCFERNIKEVFEETLTTAAEVVGELLSICVIRFNLMYAMGDYIEVHSSRTKT